uniref:Cystinosin homolog n=1 Tax=Caenorhabditis japonica TaxID=281687 RepID=A0A8R1I768_CAEJA
MIRRIIIIALFSLSTVYCLNNVVSNEKDVEVRVGDSYPIVFEIRNHTSTTLNETRLVLSTSPSLQHAEVVLVKNWTAEVIVIGASPVAGEILEVLNCSSDGSSICPLDLSDAYSRITVIRSHWLAVLVQTVGWMYFAAWSISFYPQMYLNHTRRSVVGLNFDFLALNLVGFGAYSIFNLLMYFNSHVKSFYNMENPRSPPPVLLNDVVFAVHAFLACSVTIIQCFCFERNNQKVSTKCIALIVVLIVFGFFSGIASLINKITILDFVRSLSYIKMAVTCCKYFPQAYFNYINKSTVGWSIGNILLDFAGGSMDIFQMVLQAVNVDNWSAFYSNPVKFGLGFVSIFFDMFFMLQHFVFYRNTEESRSVYAGVDNPDPELVVPDLYNDNESFEPTTPIIVHN